MKPYYKDSAVTIYHGDCLELLRDMQMVDIAFSSPPYNQLLFGTKATGMHKGSKWVAKSEGANGAGYTEIGDEDQYQKFQLSVFSAVKSKTKGIMWINHKTRYRGGSGIHPLKFYPWEFWSEIIWDRGISMVLNAKKYAPSHEYIYGFGTPHYWDNSLNTKMSVWRIAPQRSTNHPCPFPIEIVSPCIVSSCPIGGTVLDPFMGSGTTLRAAKDLGRKAIGIEIEEKYCEIAANRMCQEVLDL